MCDFGLLVLVVKVMKKQTENVRIAVPRHLLNANRCVVITAQLKLTVSQPVSLKEDDFVRVCANTTLVARDQVARRSFMKRKTFQFFMFTNIADIVGLVCTNLQEMHCSRTPSVWPIVE